jgi:hypothetical protein
MFKVELKYAQGRANGVAEAEYGMLDNKCHMLA